MITLYLLSSILIAIMMTGDILILAHPNLSIKAYPVLFVSLSALFFIQAYSNLSPVLFVVLIVNSVLLVKFSGKLYSIFYVPSGYIVNCIMLNLVGLAANMIWSITIRQLNADSFLITAYILCTMALSFPVLYLIRLLLQRYLIRFFEEMSRRLLILIAFTLFLCAFMVLTLASFFDTLEITPKEYFLMDASLILYSAFTVSMILIVLYTARKNYETQKKMEYLENLNEYTRNLETVYNSLRSFRHDYVNIMASLAAYIDEKRYEELETFFYEHLLPMQKNLTQKNAALNNLLRIHMLELKSILYTKLVLAVNQDIEVDIDIPDEIDSICMDPVDLIRVLGIYLDNAIEACLETEHPVIHFHLGKLNQDVVFILSNTFLDKGLSVAQMYKKNVTTKGAGHGVGLSNVSEILNRYDNIYHETLIEDGLFRQQVQISGGKSFT